MIPFQKTWQVIRKSDGSQNEYGAYVEGAKTVISIEANIQPVDSPQNIVLLPEGAKPSDSILIFSRAKLEVRGRKGKPADYVIWRDHEYEIRSVADYMDSPIPHYRYIGVKE